MLTKAGGSSPFLEQFPTQTNRENILRNRDFLAGNREFDLQNCKIDESCAKVAKVRKRESRYPHSLIPSLTSALHSDQAQTLSRDGVRYPALEAPALSRLSAASSKHPNPATSFRISPLLFPTNYWDPIRADRSANGCACCVPGD